MSLNSSSLLCAAIILLAFVFGAAKAETSDVETTWRLLDYIAVDYAGAVSHGQISSPSEYAEQSEFAATVSKKLAALQPKPERQALLAEADRLKQAIAAKAEPQQVAEIAHGLAAALLVAYPVPLAPTKAPDPARGAALYGQNCAACHGQAGDGHGPDAAKLDAPPIAFTDVDRARQRSIFGLYQVITQGLDGTAMASFDGLPADDRWALAFYAGRFAFPDAAEGERIWKQDASLHRLLPDLKTLVGTTPAALAAAIGQDKADALQAYLRRHPDAVAQQDGSLSIVRGRLSQSVDAVRAGDRKRAGELALSAYLDGFEPIEPALTASDRTLMERIEGLMGEYRAAVQGGETADALSDRVQVIDGLLDDAQAALSPDATSSVSTFLGAATILLREGLEALLIVVAMIAFLRKAERMEVMPYVHAGWIGALVAGFLTWVVATWVIGISGASRELTEGFGSVFAAVVLLSVGIWMHGKAQADQWQRYIREKMSKALSGRSAWFLFVLAFVVVYREVFETILFYAALWHQGNGGAILVGALGACVALAIIAWAMLRYSRRLPIGKFFTYSSWLMAVLTVVLAGKGISALQEAGIVGIAPLHVVPRLSLVGLFPTAQTVAAQIAMIAALTVGFALNHRKSV
ncbi:cytochrome c/FTR1 family iron permease [Mesorhizobium sp.]|uniref:cytochrome c/FTR1 family iron permease n=1 Tax=Mesorhizobium sp. TaxID=1871066 RepID=UPI0025F32610|nr:cytochrome c/FTR1 family iron permease [Mesorhizobium sp.]